MKNIVRLTKEDIKRLKEEFTSMSIDGSFPVFDTHKHLNLFKHYPLFSNAEYKTYIDYIEVDKICGDNWAFESEDDRGRYPSLMKLKSILSYFDGNTLYGNSELPPIPVIKVNDIYYLEEGNHRLYLFKYLNSKGFLKRPIIKAKIYEYDYYELLKKSNILLKNDIDYYLLTDSNLEYISNEDAHRLFELKSLI